MARTTTCNRSFWKELRRQLWSFYCAVTFAHVNELLDKGEAQQIDCDSACEFRPANLHPGCLAAEFDAVYKPLKVAFLPSNGLSWRQRQLSALCQTKSQKKASNDVLWALLRQERWLICRIWFWVIIECAVRWDDLPLTECEDVCFLDWPHLLC